MELTLLHSERTKLYDVNPNALRKAKTMELTLLHSERPKLWSFGLSECNKVKAVSVVTESVVIISLKIMKYIFILL